MSFDDDVRDADFRRTAGELLDEIEQELRDTERSGGAVGQRLQAMRAALASPVRLVGAEREAFLEAGE
jgi:hypothetical protein